MCKEILLTLVWRPVVACLVFLWVPPIFTPAPALAQENPYFVAYDHYLEEPGNLEIEYFSTFGTQRGGNDFHAFWGEFEYAANAWWTTELYLDVQRTIQDTTIFPGVNWGSPFRSLSHQHLIKPAFSFLDENQ